MKIFITMLAIAILAVMVGSPVMAQSTVSTPTTTQIIGLDTSTFFTILESAAQNAIGGTWNGVIINKNGSMSFQSGYDLKIWNGLVGNRGDKIFCPAVGVLTDWHYAGGIQGGINLFAYNGSNENKYHFNAKLAGFVEGTMNPAVSGNYDLGVFAAGRINVTSIFKSSAKTAKANTDTQLTQVPAKAKTETVVSELPVLPTSVSDLPVTETFVQLAKADVTNEIDPSLEK